MLQRLFNRPNSPFLSLRQRNFRRYFFGQVASNIGTWVHTIAQALLILDLTGSAQDVGIAIGAQFLPLLFLGFHAGALADKFPPRWILIGTSLMASMSTLTLALVVYFDIVTIYWIWGLSFSLGLAMAFDRPATQAILYELVGPEQLSNAIALNSLIQSSARFIGPALGSLIYDLVSPTACFFTNSGSFVLVAVVILSIRVSEMFPRRETKKTSTTPLRDAFRYAWAQPVLRTGLIINAIIGCLAFNFVTVVTTMMENIFLAPERAVGVAHSISAGGAIISSIVIASFAQITLRHLTLSMLFFGGAITASALAPNLWLFLLFAPILGFSMTTYLTMLQTTLQQNTEPKMIGRVMSLYAMGTFGTTPIGGFIVGWIVDTWSAREGLGIGAAACFGCGIWMLLMVLRRKNQLTQPSV